MLFSLKQEALTSVGGGTFTASSLVEPVRPSGSDLPVIGLPCTLSGIDWVISVRFFVGETVMTPILGVNSGVGKNLPDFF